MTGGSFLRPLTKADLAVRLLIWACAAAALVWAALGALSEAQSPVGESASRAGDRIIVLKASHEMTLFKNGHPLKTYRVALGRGGIGPKLRAGDDKVPEGVYRIVGRNGHSAFHLALRVGYPTPGQVSQARSRGVDAGGDIMIHGIRNGWGWIGSAHRQLDWTRGCIAVTNREIEEIWRLVPNGTVIEIRP
jgi:murein L,D-transpeptidase YafK